MSKSCTIYRQADKQEELLGTNVHGESNSLRFRTARKGGSDLCKA